MSALMVNALLACLAAGAVAGLGLVLRRVAGHDPVLRYRVMAAHLLAILAIVPVQAMAPALGLGPRGALLERFAGESPSDDAATVKSVPPVAEDAARPGLVLEAAGGGAPSATRPPEASISRGSSVTGWGVGWGAGWAVVGVLYLGGVVASLACGARRGLLAAAVLRGALPISDPRTLAAWHTLRARTELGRASRRARLMESAALASPACWGWVRPAVLLPRGFGAVRSDETIRCALHHELIHVGRGDHVLAVLHALLAAVFWPQPLLRRFGRALEEDREASCDALVIRGTGRAREYAAALLDCCTPMSPTAVVAGVSMGSGIPLRRRLHMLTHAHAPADRARTRLLGALSGAAILSLLAATGLLACAAAPAHGGAARGGDRSIIEVRAPEGERDLAGIMQVASVYQERTATLSLEFSGTLVEQETIASGHGDKTPDGAFATQELNLSLPEGSNLRATVSGEGITMKPEPKGTLLTLSRGEVKIYDRHGVLRVTVTTAEADATMLLRMNDDNGEHNFVARASRGGENARVVIRCDTKTGRAEGEKETPPGEFRFYTLEPDGGDAPWRLKMQWCHDLSKIQSNRGEPAKDDAWWRTNFDSYTVEPGDTPARIARMRLGRESLWPEILKYNAQLDPESPDLKPGMTLRIPRSSGLESFEAATWRGFERPATGFAR